MNNNLEKMFEAARRVRLTAAEKSEIKGRLTEALDSPRPARRAVSSPFYSRITLVSRVRVFATLAVIVIIGGFTGVSSAAAGALPGDFLYGFKVGVNEPLRGILAFSPASQVQYRADITETRLDEISALAATGKLSDPQIEEKAVAALNLSTKKFSDSLSKLGSDEASASASSGVEASIRAHENVLGSVLGRAKSVPEVATAAFQATSIRQIAASDTALSEPSEKSRVLEGLHAAADIVESKRLDDEHRITDTSANAASVAISARLSAVKNRYSSVYLLVESEGTANGDIDNLRNNMSEASSTINSVETAAAAGDFTGAFSLMQKADRIIEETRVLIQTSKYGGILQFNLQKEIDD